MEDGNDADLSDSSVETEYTDPNGSLWGSTVRVGGASVIATAPGGGSGGDSDDPYWNEVSLLLV